MLEKHHETPFWNASFCWKGVFFHETTQLLPFRAKRETPWNTIETPLKHAINETHQTLAFFFSFFFSVFPKIVVPQNGWFIMEIPDLKWMIWGKTHYFRKHLFFFSVFHWSLAQLRWWPPALWYPWVRCLTGGLWDQVQKISEEKKAWLEKSRVKKTGDNKTYMCIYCIYLICFYMYDDIMITCYIWYWIRFWCFKLVNIKKGVPISTQHSYDHHLWWPGGLTIQDMGEFVTWHHWTTHPRKRIGYPEWCGTLKHGFCKPPVLYSLIYY